LYPIKYKIDSRLKFIIERLSPNIRGITNTKGGGLNSWWQKSIETSSSRKRHNIIYPRFNQVKIIKDLKTTQREIIV